MRKRATRWTAAALVGIAAAWMLWADPALAAPPAGDAAAVEDEELGPEAGTKRPAGPDERSGHWLVQGRLGFVQPFGSIATGIPASSVVSGGAAFGGSVGVGLSRVTVLELSGAYAPLPASSRCEGCSGETFDLGLGLVYHLAQGIAIDPWIRYGVGYRQAAFTGTTRSSVGLVTFPGGAFHGIDVARIALGADFYPIPLLGFGPFLEVDAGTYLAHPRGPFGRTAYGFFQVGVRVALDPLPRGQATATARGRGAVAGRAR